MKPCPEPRVPRNVPAENVSSSGYLSAQGGDSTLCQPPTRSVIAVLRSSAPRGGVAGTECAPSRQIHHEGEYDSAVDDRGPASQSRVAPSAGRKVSMASSLAATS